MLVVEDDATVRRLIGEVLRCQGYTVVEVGNGQDAATLAETQLGQIHLLVTDVVMPGMSGHQLAGRLQSRRADLKVLFLSGYTDDAILRHRVREPGTPFLPKPFTPAALARKVREVLDQPV